MSPTRLLASVAVSAFFAHGAWAADLSVAVNGLRDGEGDVRIVLYDRADAFRHEEQARAVQVIAADKLSVPLVFTQLEPGSYAVIVYHDANRNGKMDLFLGMFPTEGWGMSNDPAVVGPPKFDPASVTVPDDGAAITVELHY